MRIIQESRRVKGFIYNRFFNYDGYVDWGFSFECDKDGKTKLFAMSDPGQQNFLSCLLGVANERNVTDKGIMCWPSEYKEPAIGLCEDCGAQVTLDDFTNTCSCGADYNWGGQRLAPRECWGEETGEHWSECV